MTYKRDYKDIYDDSSEIAEALRERARSSGGYDYWLMEAASHIESMYADLCEIIDNSDNKLTEESK